MALQPLFISGWEQLSAYKQYLPLVKCISKMGQMKQ